MPLFLMFRQSYMCLPVKEVLESTLVTDRDLLLMTNENFSTLFHKSKSKFIF